MHADHPRRGVLGRRSLSKLKDEQAELIREMNDIIGNQDGNDFDEFLEKRHTDRSREQLKNMNTPWYDEKKRLAQL